MRLLNDCMTGMFLYPPAEYQDGGPVDFVVQGTDRALILRGGWWQEQQFSVDNGFITLQGAFVAEQGRWRIEVAEGTVWLSTAESSFERGVLKALRDDRDFNRADYLERLSSLKEVFGTEDGFDFDPWIDAVLTLPRRSFLHEYRKNSTGLRKVGRIFVVDYDMMVVDVLALDENKHAATARGTPWLETHANNWATRDDDISIEDFIQWIAELQPHTDQALRGAAVVEQEGSIDDIAARMFLQGRGH